MVERKLDSRDKASAFFEPVGKGCPWHPFPAGEVLVLASDGVWDHVSSQEVQWSMTCRWLWHAMAEKKNWHQI